MTQCDKRRRQAARIENDKIMVMIARAGNPALVVVLKKIIQNTQY